MTNVKNAIATMAKNFETSTGKSVGAWVAVARAQKFDKHGEVLRWFKDKHGIGHGYANFLAKEVMKTAGEASDDGLVAAHSRAQNPP